MENSAFAWYLKYSQINPRSKLVGSTWAYLGQKKNARSVWKYPQGPATDKSDQNQVGQWGTL